MLMRSVLFPHHKSQRISFMYIYNINNNHHTKYVYMHATFNIIFLRSDHQVAI